MTKTTTPLGAAMLILGGESTHLDDLTDDEVERIADAIEAGAVDDATFERGREELEIDMPTSARDFVWCAIVGIRVMMGRELALSRPQKRRHS